MIISPVLNRNRNLFSEFNRVQNEINSLFGELSSKRSNVQFELDIWDSGDELIVAAELPGLKPEDIKTTVLANQLEIEAEFKDDYEENKDKHYFRKERSTGKVTRTLRLPYDVDNNAITGEYKHGVLTITLPKAETCKPKRITVKSA